jgi:hypothetical protein
VFRQVTKAMRGKGEDHYNDNAANYFILFVLAIITIPSTFVFLKRKIYPARDTSARCACRACKQKEAETRSKSGKFPSAGTIFKVLILVALWVVFVYLLLNSGKEAPSATYFDPYSILGLQPVCVFLFCFVFHDFSRLPLTISSHFSSSYYTHFHSYSLTCTLTPTHLHLLLSLPLLTPF